MCIRDRRNTPKKCLEDPELSKDLPELCMAQMKAFLDCKRGMVDMTKRFRGNGAMSTGKYDEQYQKLSSGNFNAKEEYEKLKLLDSASKN